MDQPFHDDTLLARWLSGELSDAEKKELEQHPDFPQWKKIVEASDRLLSPEYNRDAAWEKLRASRKSAKPAQPRLLQRITVGIAAVVLIVLGYYYWPGKSERFLEAQAGQAINHTLSDNSEVNLNASSTLSWDEETWDQNRQIQLVGEAYFSVKSGSPFTVKSPQGTVHVLGTRFNVFDRSDEGFVVTCYEGKVSVRTGNTQNLVLEAGEEATLQGNKLTKTNRVPSSTPAWTLGETIFRNKPAHLVFKELSRQYGVEVDIKQVIPKPYTGPLPHNNLKNALDIICNSLGLRYEIVTDTLIRIQED